MKRVSRIPIPGRVMRTCSLFIRHRRALSIPSHLTLHERLVLYELAKGAAAHGPVCEIGSYLGASSCVMAAGIRDAATGERLVCVDTWQNEGMAEGRRDTFAEFLANTAPYRDLLKPVRGHSHAVAALAATAGERPYSLLFCDGDHSENGVRGDWIAYRPLMAPGAIVSFHDIGWAEGVQRVFEQAILPQLEWTERLPNLVWGKLR